MVLVCVCGRGGFIIIFFCDCMCHFEHVHVQSMYVCMVTSVCVCRWVVSLRVQSMYFILYIVYLYTLYICIHCIFVYVFRKIVKRLEHNNYYV